MSQSVFVLLHIRYRLSVIFPVAFRKLVFCFVSDEVAYDCLLRKMELIEFPLNSQGNVQGHPTTVSS